jgi:ABC-type nitrate/sulfonate/bicarbonate transport system substrate-binding protein
MKPNRIFPVVFLVVMVLGSCSKPVPQAHDPLKAVTLQQEWFPFAGFAGEVSAAKRFAPANGLDLKIQPGSEQVDPIKLVLAGTAPFGVVGGDLLVAAVAKGAPLVGIGVVNEHTPTIFIVADKSGIQGPKDFIGKRVGVLPGTNTERIYQLMMKRAGVDRHSVKEIQIPFDLQTFLLKQYDVRPAFIYDETVSLEQKGFAYRIIKPSDFGVDFTGTVYFTRQDTLQKDRQTVVSLLRTLVQGWRFATVNPDDSIGDLVAAFPTLDRNREKRALELGKSYFSGPHDSPLQCDPEVWRNMIQGLEEISAIPANSVSIERVWDPSPLKEAYAAGDTKK